MRDRETESEFDRTLIEKLRDPSTREKAFVDLVQRYSKPLYSQIRRLVLNHSDCDNLLQEVFIKAWKGIASFRGDSKLYTWLYRIAYHEALDHLRWKQQRREHEVEIGEENSFLIERLVADPYFDPDEAELKLQKAIAHLPPKQRQVFLLRFYDELPYSEIRSLTGTSEGALKSSYHHAIQKIKAELTDEE